MSSKTPRNFSRRDLHLGAVFLADVDGLVRSLPPNKARIVQRLLWIAQHAHPDGPTCKCGALLSRGAVRCRACHLKRRKDNEAPHSACADCGKITSSPTTVRCRECEDIRRGARRCSVCNKKLQAKNASGLCKDHYAKQRRPEATPPQP